MSSFRILAAAATALPLVIAACAPLPGARPPGGGYGTGTGPATTLAAQTRDEALTRAERREMQQHLRHLGYNIGPVDGVIGSRTRDGIRSYQAASGLPVTGLYSRTLLDELRTAAARLGTTPPVYAGGGTSGGGGTRAGGGGTVSSGGGTTASTGGGGTSTSGGGTTTASTGGTVSTGGGTGLTTGGGTSITLGGEGLIERGGGGGGGGGW